MTGHMAQGTGDGGQSSLEVTVALIIFVILFAAAVRIFVWLNTGVVGRQVAYDDTRVTAGSTPQTYDILASNVWVEETTTDPDGTVVVTGGRWEETWETLPVRVFAPVNPHATTSELVVQDNLGQKEVGFDEPLDANLDLNIQF